MLDGVRVPLLLPVPTPRHSEEMGVKRTLLYGGALGTKRHGWIVVLKTNSYDETAKTRN